MNTTVLICAKDAEGTIQRALLSAIRDNVKQKIILVDDFSGDEIRCFNRGDQA